MAITVGVLNGSNLNKDADIQAIASYGFSEGVEKNFSTECEVEENLVKKGRCFVKATRDSVSPNEIFSVVVNITADTVIDTSGTGYVIVRLSDSKVNDGAVNNEDGTGIATIEVVSSLPSKNFLELATLSSGVITDTRTFSKLSDEIISQISKEDIGLGNVENFETATVQQHIDGVADDLFCTPEGVKASILANAPSSDIPVEAGENLTFGYPAYISTDGKAYHTQAGIYGKSRIDGIVSETKTAGQTVVLKASGILGGFSGLTAGEKFYQKGVNYIFGQKYLANIANYYFSTGDYPSGYYQTFTAPSNTYLQAITLMMKKNSGSTSENLTIKIYNSTGSTLLATSDPLPSSEFSNGYAGHQFTFSTPVSLTSGTQYRIVIGGYSNVYFCGMTRDMYSYGLPKYTGGVAQNGSDYDIFFQAHGGDQNDISTTNSGELLYIAKSATEVLVVPSKKEICLGVAGSFGGVASMSLTVPEKTKKIVLEFGFIYSSSVYFHHATFDVNACREKAISEYSTDALSSVVAEWVGDSLDISMSTVGGANLSCCLAYFYE